MKKGKIKTVILSIIVLLLFTILNVKLPDQIPYNINLEHKPDYFGVTFSKKFTGDLGLEWKSVYLAILDELNVKFVRLPIYWDDIERTENEFVFDDYDFMFEEGRKRNVQFIASVGWRLPRWPECHAPEWLREAEVERIQERTLVMLENVVNHYKEREEIIYWQVENEPLLDFFGECPDADYEFLKKEINLVRNLDNRKILVSASGELSTWSKESKIADIFGTTLYRIVWIPYFTYVKYPIPTWTYDLRAESQNIDPEHRIIIELQLEPWSPEGTIIDLDPAEYNKSMSIEQFKANIKYAIDVDWHQAYAWGAEWWYYQTIYGDRRYWELAKDLFK